MRTYQEDCGKKNFNMQLDEIIDKKDERLFR